MNPIKLPQSQPQPQPKPGAAPRPTGRRPLLWIGITALTAAVAFGIAVPRLLGHGNAHASTAPLRISGSATPGGVEGSKSAPAPATWDSSVPAASDVFVDPESSTVASAPAPTF